MDSSKGAIQIEHYDPRKNQWSVVSPMVTRRLQFDVAVVGGNLYVVGGRDGLKTLNTVECYNPRTKQWSPVPSMSTHRHGLGVATLNGPLYAVGGHDGWSYLSTVERSVCSFQTLKCNAIVRVLYLFLQSDGNS